jgi:ABC-type sugar transport system substrate-binding protein
MYPLSIRSILVIAAVVLMANSASSQTASLPGSPQTQDAKARCKQLIDYFDRYGAGRSEASDGARNMTRIGAGLDCTNGRAEEGVKAMEDLLARKELRLPPPAVGLSQSP